MKKRILLAAFALVVIASGAWFTWHVRHSKQAPTTSTVRFGISPFQDTLVPIVGSSKGWYRQEGLDVKFSILDWTAVMEALSAGRVDVAISNISSVVATHNRNPEIVYWYGLNPFDNGFALMIRPNGRIKTLAQIEKQVENHDDAVRMTAAQLKGSTVITTSATDMEQGVAAAARKGGLNFRKDIKIIDLNPDEGLAAFLRGEGDAYIGGIPQRTRAAKEGMLEMLTGVDIGPPPINGFVTTKAYAAAHPDVMLKLLHVWFETVNDIDANMDSDSSIIIDELNSNTGAQFTVADFKKFWNNYEHYPSSPREIQQLILEPTGRNYWKARWDDCNMYFFQVTHTIPQPVDPADAFLMQDAQRAYVEKYGWQ
jgi:ABC-type nitrate/sulfonate/bicarbonate transport system substrate-binding protein